MMMMKQGKISLSTVQFGIESSLGFDNHNFLKSSNDIFLVRSFLNVIVLAQLLCRVSWFGGGRYLKYFIISI